MGLWGLKMVHKIPRCCSMKMSRKPNMILTHYYCKKCGKETIYENEKLIFDGLRGL